MSMYEQKTRWMLAIRILLVCIMIGIVGFLLGQKHQLRYTIQSIAQTKEAMVEWDKTMDMCSEFVSLVKEKVPAWMLKNREVYESLKTQ